MLKEFQLPDEFTLKPPLEVGDAKVHYRTIGQGPALVLLHGYPLSSRTWRKVVPQLAKHFTCYAFDLIGLGGSTSPHDADHSSQGQARVLKKALSELGVSSYSLMGNDSGGWIARELAVLEPERVKHLVLTNTEIPDHRPPYVEFYQRLARLPGAGFLFRLMIACRLWRRSGKGFGGCFQDLDLIDGEFHNEFLKPLSNSQVRMCKALRFLVNMDFRRVDEFKELHDSLSMPVAFVWGMADPTFPEVLAREMASQFPNVMGFRSIENGKLFMHEEFPEKVVEAVIEFLTR